MKNSKEERLPISAIKQYIYCPRRFSLMFIEQQWGSNYKIVEGDFLHAKVDDPFFNEKRKELYKSRSVPVYSKKLNLYGIADIVEFNEDANGVKIGNKKGLWTICPVEYKNGQPEKSGADSYQLCAIAMCLEEMFQTTIPKGYIYYGKIKRRLEVLFTDELRLRISNAIEQMQILLEEQTLPTKSEQQNCNLCSLVNICLPGIFQNTTKQHKKLQAFLKV